MLIPFIKKSFSTVVAVNHTQYGGTWTNGRKDGIGELIFSNYKYKGSFAADQVNFGIQIVLLMYSQMLLHVCIETE